MKVFQNRKILLIAVILGTAISLSVYLGLLQRHFFSYRYIFYAFLILIFGTLFSAWLLSSVILPKYEEYPKRTKTLILLFTILLSFFLLFNVEIQPIYYLLPDSDLEINFTIPELDNQSEGVRLLWIETGQGYVHYSRMHISGKWEREFDNTIFPPNQTVTIQWTGKVGTWSEIAFRHTDFNQPVNVLWNGVETHANLNNPKIPSILIQNSFRVPLIYLVPFIVSFSLSVLFAIYCIFVLMGSIEFKGNPSTKKWVWLRFMIPMLVIWGISLLIFWPGIMSSDSISQWAQGYKGQFSDWHSVFYSFLLSLFMRIWYSPAIIVLLQIISLSFTVAWGLGFLESLGTPKIILWIVSIIFSVFPANGLLIITIWKDVAYAISFLWLTIIIMKISISRGLWLTKNTNWIFLSLSSLFTALFRQNGIYVLVLIHLALPVIFQKTWKKMILSTILFVLLFLGIKGPVFSIFEVNKTYSSQSSLVYLHHIAAHLTSGTKLTEEELLYLNSFLPVEDWDYDCCYVGTISYDDNLQRANFLASTPENRKLAINLFLRDPSVNISHMFCAGELAWKFENNQCEMKSMHGINSVSPGRVDWIRPNKYGLEDNSLLPGIVDPYIRYLRNFGFMDNKLDYFLLPGFWLFLGTFSVLIGVVRSKNSSLISTLGPIISQSLILLLISFAPAYRYHYGTCLAGIFLIGLAFIPIHEESEAPDLNP
jgi:hypothetical protein